MPTFKTSMPASKRDKTIPYTYEARVDRLGGQASEPMDHSFFADTICGLVELMVEEKIDPEDVRLYAIYQGSLSQIEVERCVGDSGDWIVPPKLCHDLEAYYRETKDDRYRGHIEKGCCAYDDRDTQGHGPY